MAINSTGDEDAWQRQALIEVTDGTSEMQLHALTETIDIDMGERELDKIDLLNLGQLPKHGSIGITTVTFEGYCQEAGSDTADASTAGYFDMFASNPVVDASQPLDIDVSNTLTRYRVAILWTEDTGADEASDATATSKKAMRFVMAECFCTSCKTTMTDGIVKQTLMFKGIAFDKSASTNIKMESNDSSASGGIPTLGAYTAGTTKWA